MTMHYTNIMTKPLRTEREMQNMALHQRTKHAHHWYFKGSVTETFVSQFRDLCNHKIFQHIKYHSLPLILLN